MQLQKSDIPTLQVNRQTYNNTQLFEADPMANIYSDWGLPEMGMDGAANWLPESVNDIQASTSPEQIQNSSGLPPEIPFDSDSGARTYDSLEDYNDASSGSKKRRRLVSRACENCRKSKLKCDEARPCGRCARNGQAELCSEWQKSDRYDDRDEYVETYSQQNDRYGRMRKEAPGYAESMAGNGVVQKQDQTLQGYAHIPKNASLNSAISFSSECALTVRMHEIGWPFAILHWYWETGLEAESMIRIFTSLPKDLERVIKVGLSAVDAIILARKSAAPVQQEVSMTCHEYSGGSIVEQMENNMWEKSVDTGCMRMIWDPIKKKRKGVHVTNQLAEMFGMSKEV